jgi:pimeloyl-ACP methyl ester carboxylesterase
MPPFTRRRTPAGHHAPEPPRPLPPGFIVHVPGRGEFFVRDSGGDGPCVLLLHGWMFASDSNWWPVYDDLIAAGLRVLALDHRGHGRGLRSTEPFTLEACALDAAALVDHLRCGPVTVVGYSMGGPVAELLARERPGVVRALVLCATAEDWQGPGMSAYWRTMSATRLLLGLFPVRAWELLLYGTKIPEGPYKAWIAAELTRGSSVDIAEAGRELGRFDAGPWIEGLRHVPSAVVVTSRDRSVPPAKQWRLAHKLGASTFEVDGDHLVVATRPERFRPALMRALSAVGAT